MRLLRFTSNDNLRQRLEEGLPSKQRQQPAKDQPTGIDLVRAEQAKTRDLRLQPGDSKTYRTIDV